MKNKAFTLIELLGVIIVLGILSVILFPSMLIHIKNAKKGISDATKALIIDAAKDYYEDNRLNYDKIEGLTYCINISSLVQGNYLNPKLKDENLDNIDTTKKIKMTYNNNTYNYEITDTCTNYALSRNNIEVPIVTENSGLYKSETDQDRFIYRGGDPINNWIEINEGTDETPNYVKYRILSFENDGTIKVVRNESIGDIAWDPADTRPASTHSYCTDSASYGCNVWGNQLNTYLGNTTFATKGINFYYEYFKTRTSSTLEAVNDGGTVSADAYLNTYLNPISQTQTNKWDKALDVDKYMIEHPFNVGGVYYTSTYEGSKGITKERQEEKSLTWNGKIGLMNITEFVEASTNSECTLWNNYYYNPIYYYKDEETSNATFHAPENDNYPCKTYNWTITENNQWSLTPSSILKYNVWTVNSAGYFNGTRAYNTSYGVRPAFYLKPSISLIGEGSEANPYRIME